MKRAVIYARVSTSTQMNQGFRIDKQVDDMRDYCQANGFDTIAEFTEAHSATVPFHDRPNGSIIYQMVERGQVDVVVVHDIDRAERGSMSSEMPVAFMLLLRDLTERGVELHTVDGKVQDGITTMIQAWLAKAENKKRRERSMQGRRKKIESGRYAGNGAKLFGYRVQGRRKETELVIDDDEAKVVRYIFDQYVSGVGVVAICERLNTLGYLSMGDKVDKGKKRGRGEWSTGQVYPILKNETYSGVWYGYKHKVVTVNGKKKRIRRPRSEWVGVSVPAIIDRQTWEHAQNRLSTGRKMSRRSTKHEYLMGRRVSCSCGYRVQGKPSHTTSGSRKVVYLYYQCNGKYGNLTTEPCSIDLPRFRVSEVDGLVWEWVFGLLMEPERMLKEYRRLQGEQTDQNRPLIDELDRVKAMVDDQQSQLERLLDLYLTGSFDASMLDDKKTVIEKTIRDLTSRAGGLETQLRQATITDEQIQTFVDFSQTLKGVDLNDATFDERRGIIDALGVTATLSVDDDGQRVVYVRCGGMTGQLSRELR